jgi:hypothetical protein
MPHPLARLVHSLLPVLDAEGREVVTAGDPPDEHTDSLVVTLRTLSRDDDGQILNLFEQQLVLVRADFTHPALEPYLRASFAALPQILREDGHLLPCDLFFPELLADPVPDFTRLLDPAWRAATRTAAETAGFRETYTSAVGEHRVDALLALRRPRWLLRTEQLDHDTDDAGPSHLGGHPDLPSNFAWPRLGVDPLTFLAQIDLSTLPRLEGPDADLLPHHGLLSLFFNHDGDSTDGHGALFYFPDPTQLVRTAAPPRTTTFPTYAVTAEAERPSLPGWEQPHYTLLMDSFADDPEHDVGDPYSRALEPLRNLVMFEGTSWPEGQPRHQLLGHPHVLQSDCLAAAAHAEREQLGQPHPHYFSRAHAEQAAQWRLLLQIDSEDDLMLGDVGEVHVVIREPDLRARRFDRARVVFQCH